MDHSLVVAEAAGSPVVQIDTIEAILGIIVTFVVAGIAWGALRTSVGDIRSDVAELKADMKDVRERFANLEGKNSGLYKAQSPVNLTPLGKQALVDSGLQEFIDSHRDQLVDACERDQELPTSYDVQQCVFAYMDELDFPADVADQIKTYAFDNGLNMDMMRRVGAIYLRNIILSIKGYDPQDLDNVSS